MTMRSEAFGVIAVVIAPRNSFGDSAKLFDRPRRREIDRAVERVHKEFLARLDLQFLAKGLWDDNLKLGRDFDFG
jgi:hypothetical protein